MTHPGGDPATSARTPSPDLGVYWRFYWPLAITGAIGVVAVQFQNGALARYPEGTQELAIFALAQGVFALFRAATDFIPQLVTRFARGAEARRVTLRYVIGLCAGCAVAIELIGQSSLSAAAISRFFGVEGYFLLRVLAYLCLLAPLMLVEGVRMACVGMLVQRHLTGRVTFLNVVFLVAVALSLVIALLAELPATIALIGAQGIGSGLHAALGVLLVRRSLRSEGASDDVPDVARLTRFFVPVATTGLMFALTRPLLYAFVARTPEGVVSIAALRIAFDFTFFFQQASNQFRHFFVAFGLDDLAGKRRFMGRVTVGITALMLLVAATPLGEWLLRAGLGVDGDVLERARQVILVMCLLPLVIIVRNYYHGILMVAEQTAGMATGGILRVLLVAGASAAFAAAGLLDHLLAAWIMLAGFGIETLEVLRRVREARRRGLVPA